MNAFRATLTAAAAAAFLSQAAMADPIKPLEFFEGRTESIGTIKVVLKKAFKTHSSGTGKIGADGTLLLVQKVEDEGKPPRERRWKIRQTAPGKFSGTMSEATGPVTVEEVDGRYRFRFKMKGGLSVEQWVIPSPGGKTAKNTMTIKKLGVTVATGTGTIRKL
jgi:uncharacterized protein DUF3833